MWMLLIGLTSLLIAIPLYSSTSVPFDNNQETNNGSGADHRSAQDEKSSKNPAFPAHQSRGIENMGTTLSDNTSHSEQGWATPTLLTRITSIVLLFRAAISFNRLYVQAIGSGLGLYSGLFHVTTVTQAMEIFLYTMGAFILLPWAKESSCSQSIGNGQVPTRFGMNGNTMIPSIPEYPLIVLFTTMGATFLISSADLVSMYLSIELQSFAVYILAAIYRNSETATSAGLKYFLLGALSSALILLGSSLIYAYTGLTNFEGIYTLASVNLPDQSMIDHGSSYSNVNSIANGVVLGVLIIGVGFLFKVAAAPFHNWAPDVYDGVPTIVTTWLTVMPKISIFIFLLELQVGSDTSLSFLSGLLSRENTIIWKNLLLTTSMLSLIIGTVVGLAQYRLKRLLAFSTISHVGFLLLALSVNSEESITSFLFYLVQYSVTNLNAFFVVLAFGYILLSKANGGTDITFITQLKGQFHDNPILGLSLALCLFSMAGIPPLVGFFAKYTVLYSAIENGYYFIALIGILASVISAAYYLRIIRVIHFSSPSSVPVPIFDRNGNELVAGLGEVFSNSSTQKENNRHVVTVIGNAHSYVIAVLTLFVVLFLLSPSLLLNSSNLLALSLFTA